MAPAGKGLEITWQRNPLFLLTWDGSLIKI